MKFGEGDRWQRQAIELPTDQFVTTLAFAGFNGLYLDRYGYSDNGQSKEAELSAILGVTPVVSADSRLVFFDMRVFTERLRQQYGSDWAKKADLALHPLVFNWSAGFSGLESSTGKTWRWCSATGELQLSNSSQTARTISLEMAFASGYKEQSELVLSGLISEQLKVNENPLPYSKTITVPPGTHVIRFVSNARRVDAPNDPRVLMFRIENFRFVEQ